jgi:hypothetical protein
MVYKKYIISRKSLFVVLCLSACLYFLFYVKYGVNNLIYQKTELQRLVFKEKENIIILNAELSMLKNLTRIRKIVSTNLPIVETRVTQIILNENDNKIPTINNIIDNGNWRYKKSK